MNKNCKMSYCLCILTIQCLRKVFVVIVRRLKTGDGGQAHVYVVSKGWSK